MTSQWTVLLQHGPGPSTLTAVIARKVLCEETAAHTDVDRVASSPTPRVIHLLSCQYVVSRILIAHYCLMVSNQYVSVIRIT